MLKRQRYDSVASLQAIGITYADASALRRVSMQLHRWHELECGVENGGVERDEKTGKCFWYSSYSGNRFPCADRETGALKRLAEIMSRYPDLTPYVQGDPRGAALYVLTPQHFRDDKRDQIDSFYSRGVAVYKES